MRRSPAPPHVSPSGRSARPRRPQVSGAPLVLPPWLDEVSDRWWRLTPRVRTLTVAAFVASLLAGVALRAAASPYGPPAPALVAAGDLSPGTTLDASVLRRVRWPADLVPVDRRLQPTGTLVTSLPEGAVLTDGHVTDDGLGGLVGPGRSAVPLPAELVPELPVGTRVQVVATGVDGDGTVLADAAQVVAGDGTSLWLAVPDAAAADVAAAGLRGSVTVAVLAVDGPDP
jgi:hypothetical protein